MKHLEILSFLFVSLISFDARADMSRIYVQMPILPNNPIYSWDDYRTRHFAVTGYKIPAGCSQNTQGTHYLSGELVEHFTEAQQDTLKSEFPMVLYTDGWPVGWVNKVVSE